MISASFPGWTFTEIREFTPRERKNWIELGIEAGKLVRTGNG